MGFTAEGAIAPLDFDFRPFVDAHGVTPEPSAEQLRRFRYQLREVSGAATEGAKDVAERLAGMSEEEFAARDEEFLDALAGVTSGAPSREQIAALPARYQQAYTGSLIGDLFNPEASSAATKPSLRAVGGA